jgi:cysteine desulfurase family protein
MVYFDNAATTFPKPEAVYSFMDRFYREFGANAGRGQHKMAFTANKLREETRGLLLDLFNCPAKKVVFTNTATEALNIILQGVNPTDGSNIYITPFEHNAVTRVLHHLGEIHKLNIKILTVDRMMLDYDLEKIKYQFSESPPHLVVMSHASNVCGLLAPIKEICELSKGYQAINIIDMAQTAGLIDMDLSSNIYDFAVFAGHKTLYGPFGIAGFISSGEIPLRPLLFGGTGVESADQHMPVNIPNRYEVGSPNIAAIAGLNAALKWVAETGIENIYETEKGNHAELLRVLGEFRNIEAIRTNDASRSIGIVSCLFKGYNADSIGQILSERDIAVRTGLHCAPYAHRFLGTYPAGAVRFSVSYFNTQADFEKLHDVLRHIDDNS